MVNVLFLCAGMFNETERVARFIIDSRATFDCNLILSGLMMLDGRGNSPEERVFNVVRRLFTERSISRLVEAQDDLREAGLTSLDMVNLVLAIEAEFDVNIPEGDITPANFRSIAAISRVVAGLLK